MSETPSSRSYRCVQTPLHRALRLAATAVVLVTLLTGCETDVSVIEESDLVYSISGVLNVNSTTQTIRVELLRDGSYIGSSGKIDADVTLRDLTAGRNLDVTLEVDTVESIPVNHAVTTDPLEYGHEYRFVVDGPAGRSSAQVTTPAQPPVLGVDQPLRVEGCPPLGDAIIYTDSLTFTFERAQEVAKFDLVVSSIRNNDNPTGLYRFERIQSLVDEGDGVYTLDVDTDRLLTNVARRARPFNLSTRPEPVVPLDFQILYASAGPEWPENFVSESIETLATPTNVSNVEGGVGFLGAVHQGRARVPIDLTNTCGPSSLDR